MATRQRGNGQLEGFSLAPVYKLEWFSRSVPMKHMIFESDSQW